MCTISLQITECVPGSHKGYIKPEGKAMDQACLRQLEDKGNIQPAVQCENKYLIDHIVAFIYKKMYSTNTYRRSNIVKVYFDINLIEKNLLCKIQTCASPPLLLQGN